MKVLFVLKTFPVLSETFIVNQITSLIDLGADVRIFSYDIGKDPKAYSGLVKKYNLCSKTTYLAKPQSIIIRILIFFKFILLNLFKLKIEHFRNIRKLYQYQNLVIDSYDVVHCHFGDLANVFANEFINTGFFSKAKKICTFHGFDLIPSKIDHYKEDYKNLLTFIDVFTYNTPYLGHILFDLNPYLRTFQLPVGFNKEFLQPFKNKKQSTENLKLLFCGRLVNWKGCYELMDIMQYLVENKETKIILDIIGDGPEAYNLKKLLDNNPELKKQINIRGAQSQEEVFKAMNDADIFLFPGKVEEVTGRAETQGLVVQEAQFFNLPVIVSDAGGTKYGLLDGQSGFVVKSGDISGFAEKILFFKNNRKNISEFGQAGYKFVMENYSSEKLGKLLLKIYKI